MGVRLPRSKKRNYLLSFFYLFDRILFFSNELKFKLYLNLAWIFHRLAHEKSVKYKKIDKNILPKGDFLAEHLGNGVSVLDIGCGEGHIASRIIDRAGKFLGVDYNDHSISVAAQKFNSPNIKFLNIDIFKHFEAYPEEKFDVIIMSHLLEHIDEPTSFLAKVYPFADRFYVEVPDFDTSHLNYFRKHFGLDLVYTDADHVSEFDRYELKEMFKLNNYYIEHEEYISGVMKFWLKK
jgi:SAM-dependent methyltransferase